MDYFKELAKFFLKVEAKDKKGRVLSLDKAISASVSLIIRGAKNGNKVMIIGNGGSASIASHISTDLLKNARIPSLAFNDPSLITCLSNDLGYDYVFAKPIEMLAKKGDILISLSSSGKSKNILNASFTARKQGCNIITLSGFSNNNPLRSLGDINFYLPSNSYGFVEITHLAICHSIVDKIIKK
jgi:D-sedoheptulose 7-phosphate isomerase